MCLSTKFESLFASSSELRRTQIPLALGTTITGALDAITFLGTRFFALTFGPFSPELFRQTEKFYTPYASRYFNLFTTPFAHLLRLVHPKTQPEAVTKELLNKTRTRGCISSYLDKTVLPSVEDYFFKEKESLSFFHAQIKPRILRASYIPFFLVAGFADLAIGAITGVGALITRGKRGPLNTFAINQLRATPAGFLIEGIAAVLNPNCELLV